VQLHAGQNACTNLGEDHVEDVKVDTTALVELPYLVSTDVADLFGTSNVSKVRTHYLQTSGKTKTCESQQKRKTSPHLKCPFIT